MDSIGSGTRRIGIALVRFIIGECGLPIRILFFCEGLGLLLPRELCRLMSL
jgi:hypothetical protein